MTIVEVTLCDSDGKVIKGDGLSPGSFEMLTLGTQPPCCKGAQINPLDRQPGEATWMCSTQEQGFGSSDSQHHLAAV